MKNYVSEGNVVEVTAPVGGVVSGNFYKIGRLGGVATVTAAQGEKFNLLIEGVVDVAKVAAEPWTEGLLVWWNSASALATSVSTTAMLMGVAVAGAVNPSATGRVKLNYGSWLNQ